MNRFVAAWMLVIGLLSAGGANAVPVTWTIPATTLSGSGNSISGTFVYDADTNTTSSINLTQTNNSVSSTLTVAGANTGGYVRFVVANAVGQQGAYLISSGLTNAGGSVTITSGNLGIGTCGTVTSGLCSNILTAGSNSSSVTITGVAPAPAPSPAPIPTLSEWAEIMMMFLMILTVGWQWRKQQN